MRDIPDKKLSLRGREGEEEAKTPQQALGMMWRLALDAWSFKEKLDAEPRLQRHVVVLKRRGG